MKIEESQVYKCTLTLSLREAEILKGMMQNCNYASIENEPQEERELREKLFNSITLGYTGIRSPIDSKSN